MGDSLIVNLTLLGQSGLEAISFHYCQQLNPKVKKENVNNNEGDVKGGYNVNKYQNTKSCRASLKKNNNYIKNREKK